jgi:predicted ATPase
MLVRRVRAKNFLSFQALDLKLDKGVSVIVGPNGSGKTNLVRVFQLVRDVVNSMAAGRQPSGWDGAARRDGPPEFNVGLDVEFAEDELKLWEIFFEGALASAAVVLPDQEARTRLIEVGRQRRPHYRLRRGSIEVEFTGPPERLWLVRYVGNGLVFTLHRGWPVISRTPEPAASLSPVQLEEYLRHIFQADARGVIGALLSGLDDLIDEAQRQGCVLQFAVNLSGLSSASRELYRALSRLSAGHAGQLNFLHVLDYILRRRFLLTDDIRPWPRDSYFADQIGRPVELEADGSNLALYLYWLKNSPEPEDRRRLREVAELFNAITGCRLDVTLRSSSGGGFDLPVLISQAGAENPFEASLRYSGAGTWEALVLSAFLVLAREGGSGLLVLDEPALNLHPSRQRRVLAEVIRAARAGAQAVLVTHSPYLVPVPEDISDLGRITRFRLEAGSTRPIRLRCKPDQSGVLGLLVRSPDMVALLFAQGVILLEGETEGAALPVWWARLGGEDGGPEDHNLAVRHVGGYKAFAGYVRLLEGWGIPFALVVDGGHLRGVLKLGGLRRELRIQLDESRVDAMPFEELRAEAEKYGIFTLNKTEHDEDSEKGPASCFETLPYVKAALETVPKEYDTKPLRGLWVASKADLPPEAEEDIRQIYKRVLGHLKRKDF